MLGIGLRANCALGPGHEGVRFVAEVRRRRQILAGGTMILPGGTKPLPGETLILRTHPELLMPHWADLPLLESDWRLAVKRRRFDGRGWPLISLWCELPTHELSPRPHEGRGAIQLLDSPWRLGTQSYPRAVPLLPVWPGFAVNTAFYAAVLWLPFGPFALRRFIRRKRGQCLRCGYPMGMSSVCTECGRELAT